MSSKQQSDQSKGNNGEPSQTQVTHPSLDIKRLQELSSDLQDVYLLTFVSTLTKHVEALDADGCSAQQVYLKRELLQILNLPAPPPTRLIRRNIGRCFAHIYGKGDRKLLFETINELVAIINQAKHKDQDSHVRHAAVSCLGDVFAGAGDSAVGYHPLACSTLLKALKGSSGNASFRAGVYNALSKIIAMLAGRMDETVVRDIWKSARSTAPSDKSYLVQVAACQCLKACVVHTPCFDFSVDFDKLKSVMWKTIDSANHSVREAAADCLSESLVKNYADEISVEAETPKLKKPKRVNTKRLSIANDEEEIQRPSSPSTKKSQLLLSLPDILVHLSTQYIRQSSNSRTRAGIASCYCKIFQKLPERVVEMHYAKIMDHLLVDLLDQPTVTSSRYRLLSTRRFIQIILEDVVGQTILGQAGQMQAARTIIDVISTKYFPSVKERAESSKNPLISAISALSSLLKGLGAAVHAFAESCLESLLQALQHPSYTVQAFASRGLLVLTDACPQFLLPCLNQCLEGLNQSLATLASSRTLARRCVGYANGLSAAISVTPRHPLHGSIEFNSRVLSLATNLLKTSSNSELRMSSTQIQVAWTLIGGLMTLGPSFVKIHLAQLLLLWKNALPKPLARDNTAQRTHLESSFLTHVRECASGSILVFLKHNSKLITADVSKRLAVMLQNTIDFLKTLPHKKTAEDLAQRLSPSLQLQDLHMMVQRRVLQCYTILITINPSHSIETLLQSSLLTLAVSCFADPEEYTPTSLSTSIANSAGTFDSIWDTGDNRGFGLTGLVRGFDIRPPVKEHHSKLSGGWRKVTGPTIDISNTILSPICGSLEHDILCLYLNDNAPDPPATEVINIAINLFAVALPLTPAKVQESILEQITTFLATTSLQRDLGRKAAMDVNVATALHYTLKVVAKETTMSAGDLNNPAVEILIRDLLRNFTIHRDQYVRNVGYQSLAKFCNTSNNALTSNEIKHLIDTIVVNREPHVRAGCAMALGCIHAQVGGMAAGYHLKTILGILMSLCSDPHPTVHYWSLKALAKVAESAGLTFSGYVSSALGMVAQLYVADSHNPELMSAASSNLELDLSTTAVLCRCVDSLINVLGPDLQDVGKSRDLIGHLIAQFQQETDEEVLEGTLICLEHMSLYAPGHTQFVDYVKILESYMLSPQSELRDIAVDGLYNLMKRNTKDVLDATTPEFEEHLWLVLDIAPNHDGIKNLIMNWIQQTCIVETTAWLQRIQNVWKFSRNKKGDAMTPITKGPILSELQDEEVAGFASATITANGASSATASTGQVSLRWQVHTFAMSCLAEIFDIIGRSTLYGEPSPSQLVLQSKIADVIRMAFTASTSGIIELRIQGLQIIGSVLKMFGKTADPDFPEASLLEQYQAQISSALTPAFAADSSPELAAEAINVCAVFTATGIVTDVERMGRILKTLVSALESCTGDSETIIIGDLKCLSANAQIMVKMAVLSAWAELQVASLEQQYLTTVLHPHIGVLTPLWLSSLREFARLRFEPDISMSLGPPSLSGSPDSIYSAFNRETQLSFYQNSWLNLVDAIASLIEQDSDFVFDALDGKEIDATAANGHHKHSDINYRDEPVAFFFVLFGIAFEALVTRPASDASVSHSQTHDILQALKKILHPSVSGSAIYRDAIFAETMDLLDRLALTEGLDVQLVVVQIARSLCMAHPSAKSSYHADDADLSEDIEQLFELTRIMVLVLSGLLPNLVETNRPAKHELTEDMIQLVKTCLDALVDAAAVFPAIIKTDLHACIIHVFATILATPSCQVAVVPQSLPILKRFFVGIAPPDSDMDRSKDPVGPQLQGCLKRFLSVYTHAQKRESENSLACVKNVLLAITVLISSSAGHLPACDPLVGQFLNELVECLQDRMVSTVHSGREVCMQTRAD